ncbi:MAG: cupin domain-containing protein [Campylobacterales bacterium]|nr:cupin domain-containing protein [Campylobacterales bacterium]
MIRKSNLYQGKAPEPNHEIFSTLYENTAVRIESIRSSLKTPGEWYDQKENEWVLLCEGEARLEMDGEIFTMERGDHLLIPKHTPHRVLSTAENTYWIGVFSS